MTAVLPGRRVGAALVSIAVLGLTGCGDGGGPGAAGTLSSATATSSTSWSRPDSPPDPRTLLRAGGTALATVPDSTLIFIDSETDDAGTWKIRVITADGTEQQLKIGSDGVTVLVGPTPKNDGDTDKAERRARVRGAQLDYRSAVDKVLAAVPNGSITELKLTGSNGSIVWEADVWDSYLVEHRVTLNAASGELDGNTQG